jgi:hypothetical protein
MVLLSLSQGTTIIYKKNYCDQQAGGKSISKMHFILIVQESAGQLKWLCQNRLHSVGLNIHKLATKRNGLRGTTPADRVTITLFTSWEE